MRREITSRWRADVVSVAAALVVAFNCGGETELATDPCIQTRRDIGGSDVVVEELGFSADEVLGLTSTERSAQLTWHDTAPRVSYRPGSGETVLNFRAPYQNGAIEFVERVRRSGSSDDGCRSTLEVEVECEVRTDDGALDETVSGRLSAESSSFVDTECQLGLSELNGDFEVTSIETEDDEVELFGPSLDVTSSDVEMEGTLGGRLEGRSGSGENGVVTTRGVTFARWPARPLCEWGAAIPLELEYEGGRSGCDLLAAFEDPMTLPWIWRDGAVTELGFSLVSETGVACVGEDFDDGVDLVVPALAEVSTDDGRLSGSIPVTLLRGPETDGTTALSMGSNLWADPNGITLAEMAEWFPLLGVDLESLDGARVDLIGQFALPEDGEASVLALSVEFRGGQEPECPGPPEPCPGLSLATLEQGELAP